MAQARQTEWTDQWARLGSTADQPESLFHEWISPHDPAQVFRGARVLDAGCGGGQQAALVSPIAREVVALDLNTAALCRERLSRCPNVRVHDGDLARVTAEELGGPFDVVYSIGVVHHTQDPDASFANLVSLVRPGGKILVWVYSLEGNAVTRLLVEPARRLVLRFLPRVVLWWMSWVLGLELLLLAHTLYRLPLPFLPCYEYIRYSRGLSARKVVGNVYDKLSAPHTDFISRPRIEGWLARPDLEATHLSPFLGVSYRASATKKK